MQSQGKQKEKEAKEARIEFPRMFSAGALIGICLPTIYRVSNRCKEDW